MADVPGKFYRATKVRTGVAPSSAGSIEGEVLPPVNPPGSSLNSVGLTMPSAFTVSNSPLTSNGTIGVAGAGTVAQYIRGDGSLADFPESSGGGSSVSYYLNGSVDQGTIGGIAYKELSKVPILGSGTDFTINADGYIASFITDAGDPNLLEIPGGNWNFETYFSASSSGGTPTFYVELYKVSGTTATLIASSSSAPELIAFGTNLTPYFSSLAVPTTTLALTDRLAVRYYVTHSGRTITLHTENNHLCQIITTFTTGLTALNGLTAQVQNFAVGTTGTDFNIASATATHTFNLPTASATNRGALSSADWSLFTQAYNDKINSAAVTGTTTKTLTLTQQDGGTITASWSDLNTDAVLSVFGRTGAVVAANGDYTTAQVTESGNLYYTDARSRAALSFAAGSGAYNTSTGVITIPTNNNQITNGAGYITSAALAGYLPLTGGTLTGPLGGTTISLSGDITANRYRGVNSLVLNSYTTVNPSSNVYLYSPPNDRDAWIYLDSADTGSNWGIYHRQIDSAVSGLPANSIGFVGGGSSTLQAWISLENGNGFFAGSLTAANLSGTNTGNVTIGTANGLSLSGQALSLGLASGSANGALSSTDWTTFNNKQNALTNPVTGTGSAGQVAYWSSGSAITGESNLFYDSTNDRLGVGTDTPSARITVRGNGVGSAIDWVNTEAGTGRSYRWVSLTQGGFAIEDLTASGARRFIISSTGNIGIGIDTPTNARLVISSSANDKISLDGGSSQNGMRWEAVGGANGFYLYNGTVSSSGWGLYNINTAASPFFITNGGNFIIGSTLDAGFKLDVNGTGRFTSSLITEGNINIITTNSPTQSILLNNTPTNNDTISLISFGARWNSTTYGTGAQIRASASGTWSSTNYGTNLTFSTVSQNTDVNLERLQIQSNGNILFKGQSTTSLAEGIFQNTNSALNFFATNTTSFSKDIGFFTNTTTAQERMRILANGNILIANTSDNGQAIVQIGGSNNTKLSLKDGSSQNGMRWESVGGASTFYLFNGNFGTTGWGLYNVSTAATPLWITNGSNVLIGTTTDNGARFQVSGTSTFSGQLVQGAGAARSTNGTTVAFTGGSQTIYSSNSDPGDTGRFLSIVNENTSTNAFSALSFRVNPNGGSNNAMLDMKFVNSNSNNSSTLYWSFLSGGSFFDRMALTSAGNLLIGTTTTIGPAAGRVDILYSGLVQYGMNIRSSHTDGIAISFVNSSGTQVGTIYQNSSSTAYNTSSDYRLKTDLKDFNGVEIINKIKTYDFEWKTDKTRSYGVIAHELKEVIDYAVFGEKDSVTMQGVDYSKLVPIMVKAIQEQQQEIKEIKNKLS